MKLIIFQAVIISSLIFQGCETSPTQKHSSAIDSYQSALHLVESAKEVLGGTAQIESSGGIYLRGEGIYDLSTRLQGKRPNVTEYYPAFEQLAVDPASGMVAFETDTYVNPDAREIVRNFYDGQNRSLYMDLYNNFSFWNASLGTNQQSKRYSNMVPHLLLEEALLNRKTLRHMGTDDKGNEMVSFQSPTFGMLTIYINTDSKQVTAVEYIRDIELRGDTSVKWFFKEYKHVEGIGPYPTGYTITIQDQILKDITYDTIQAGAGGTPVTVIPDSINLPEMPPSPAAEQEQSSNSDGNPIRDPLQLADRVHIFPHIRSGFHTMVVEFDEYLVAVEAPAEWLEFKQLPAREWSNDESSSSTGWRFLHAIREKLSEKPVRYIVLTHHHGDHIGGLRPFVEVGTTILTSAVTAPVVERALQNSYTYAPDELAGKTLSANIEIVDNEYTISDDSMEVRIIDVGDNPHSDGMLVVYLPNEKILYNSDLFEPINSNDFPSRARVPVMKWFVKWLDNSELDYERVYAIHAGLRVSENHMDFIRNLDQNPNQQFQYE